MKKNLRSGTTSSMDSEGLCRIIETCAKNKVLDLSMGDIKISFLATFEEIVAREQARPVSSLGTAQEVTALEQQALAEIEDEVEAEYEANLLASDPLAYEKYMISRDEKRDIPRRDLEEQD